ncbi:FAD-binding protein [Sphingomonas koreensis]|nr:FAD-binding protein [Sphingomonas koreensis]
MRPTDEASLAPAVAAAAKVRVTGAGHSFMPLCETNGLLVSLEHMAGRLRVAADRRTVTAPAGWSLKRLTAALWDERLSLINQGDVNPQSLAGATSTGTHGTGRGLGSLATICRGFRLMQADGSIITCSASENSDLFEAQRLSLGLFGITLEIEIDVIPAFYLEERIEKRKLADIAAEWDALTERHRHIEFWLFPHSDTAILKTLSLTDPCDPPVSTTDMGETAFRRVCEVGAKAPWLIPTMQKGMMATPMASRRAGPAYAIFPSDRTVRFEEMEYELPKDAGMAALREVLHWIRAKKLPVAFPFEYRLVAGDDIWMSPMNRGDCVSISMHQFHKMPWRALFAEAEAIFRAHGGRPHWAKRHTLTRDDVDALYPMAGRYRAVRRAHDPAGKFLNPHLEGLFA